MTCNKCKKEFQDEFSFCPYCGKKKPEKGRCLCLNRDYLAFGRKDIFHDLFDRLKRMTDEDAREWLHEKDEYPDLYAVKVRWDDEIGEHTFRCFRTLTREEFINILDRHLQTHTTSIYMKNKCSLLGIEISTAAPNKQNLLSVGAGFYYTKEEALAEARQRIEIAKREGVILDDL